MATKGIQLAVSTLTPRSFEPFGRVIAKPPEPPTATGEGWQWWSDVDQITVLSRPHGLGFLSLHPAELAFDWAERHGRTQELIVPLGGRCLIYVAAPTAADVSEAPAPEDFQIFALGPDCAALLNIGVWHGAPLALNEPLSALVVLREGTGTQDTEVVKLAKTRIALS